jgi:hypothetical protein
MWLRFFLLQNDGRMTVGEQLQAGFKVVTGREGNGGGYSENDGKTGHSRLA